MNILKIRIPFIVVFCLFVVVVLNDATAQSITERYRKGIHSGDVRLYSMYEDGEWIGNSIWLSRKSKKVKAKYFASGSNVAGRYKSWSSTKTIVTYCSGAFADNLIDKYTSIGSIDPVGLNVDNGIIVNKIVDPNMDAIVIVQATGGIVVSNIKDGNLTLYYEETSFNGQKISKSRIVDLSNVKDKDFLLNWAVSENATIFQTHLLAYSNELKLNKFRARKKHRERRLLGLIKDRNNVLYHVIFNLPNNHYLGDISDSILRYIRDQRGMELIALLNLDTGRYDILRFYNEDGTFMPDIVGQRPLEDAINLIVYYYDL